MFVVATTIALWFFFVLRLVFTFLDKNPFSFTVLDPICFWVYASNVFYRHKSRVDQAEVSVFLVALYETNGNFRYCRISATQFYGNKKIFIIFDPEIDFSKDRTKRKFSGKISKFDIHLTNNSWNNVQKNLKLGEISISHCDTHSATLNTNRWQWRCSENYKFKWLSEVQFLLQTSAKFSFITNKYG